MKFTKDGIERRLDEDIVIWIWPWNRPTMSSRIYSQNNLCFFDSMKHYWQFTGWLSNDTSFSRTTITGNDRLKGYSWLDVLSTWIHFRYPNENLVVLTNIDVGAKGMSFWLRLPKDKIEGLLNDVVVIRCDSAADVKNAVTAVADKFAEAYGFIEGRLVYTNTEVTE